MQIRVFSSPVNTQQILTPNDLYKDRNTNLNSQPRQPRQQPKFGSKHQQQMSRSQVFDSIKNSSYPVAQVTDENSNSLGYNDP